MTIIALGEETADILRQIDAAEMKITQPRNKSTVSLPEGPGKTPLKPNAFKSQIGDSLWVSSPAALFVLSLNDTATFYAKPMGYHLRAASLIYNTNSHGFFLDVHILAGKNDALLKWPFPGRVILTLYDQSGQGYHYVRTAAYAELRSWHCYDENYGRCELWLIGDLELREKMVKNDFIHVGFEAAVD